MNPSQKQAIEAKAEELYPMKEWFSQGTLYTHKLREQFELGATFGLSLQTNEWVSVKDRYPINEDAGEYGYVLVWNQTLDTFQKCLWYNVGSSTYDSHWRKIVKPDLSTPPNK